MKKLTEEADQEKALKDVAVVTTKEKEEVAAAAKEKAQSSEGARLVMEKKLSEA